MQILQNVALIEATINPSNRRVTLTKDILRGKKIQSLFLFAGGTDFKIGNPITNEEVSQLPDIRDFSLFLNLTDSYGNQFVKEYSALNFLYRIGEFSNLTANINEFAINRVLNLDTCYLSFKGDINAEIKIILYVFYQTQNFDMLNDTVNGSVTIELPTTPADVKLSTLIHQTLNGKKIRKIIPSSQYNLLGYLDLICKRNRFENLPLNILSDLSPKELYFDGIEIDLERSYFRNRTLLSDAVEPIQLTFIY